jgi:hypothetical protein
LAVLAASVEKVEMPQAVAADGVVAVVIATPDSQVRVVTEGLLVRQPQDAVAMEAPVATIARLFPVDPADPVGKVAKVARAEMRSVLQGAMVVMGATALFLGLTAQAATPVEEEMLRPEMGGMVARVDWEHPSVPAAFRELRESQRLDSRAFVATVILTAMALRTELQLQGLLAYLAFQELCAHARVIAPPIRRLVTAFRTSPMSFRRLTSRSVAQPRFLIRLRLAPTSGRMSIVHHLLTSSMS